MTLQTSYSAETAVVLIPLVPDGLMVSSSSAIYSKNPSPGSPRAGASSWSASVGAPHPCRGELDANALVWCGTTMFLARLNPCRRLPSIADDAEH